METILGPVHGYWLACYTVQAGDGHHAYAKICRRQPQDVWTTPHAVCKLTSGPCPDRLTALDAVVGKSLRWMQVGIPGLEYRARSAPSLGQVLRAMA